MTYKEADKINDLFFNNIDPDYADAIKELNEEFNAGQVALYETAYKKSTGLIDKKGKEILIGDIFEVDGKQFRNIGDAYDFANNYGFNILKV